jgi:modulator of FtsH protease HflK
MKNVTPPFDRSHLFHPRWIFRGVLAVIALWAFFSCFTTVPADSYGVRVRLGHYIGYVDPGLRFMLPLGIDQMIDVPVQRQLQLEFGFSSGESSNSDRSSSESEGEAPMVTGDLNMALVEWVVQYRIKDPEAYLFHVRDPVMTLHDASESAMREVIGDRTVDEVLTIGRQEVESECLVRLEQLSDRYGLGLGIVQVQLKNVHPPQPVQASFNEVNQAQQEKQQQINVADGEYNKAVPRAKGVADQGVSTAEGYALRRVNEAHGDAERFNAQFTEYLKAPEITRERLYYETMTLLLPEFERKVILDDKAGQLLPLLPLELNKALAPK